MTVASKYDEWHEQRASLGLPTATNPWHTMALRHLGDIEGLHVLEAGCGLGEFARELVDRGGRVVAVDLSPVAVAEAKRLSGADAVVADVANLPFADEMFDLVVSLETLEHVPQWTRALDELVRVLRPGGRLIVTTPNYISLMGLYRLALRLTGRRFQECGQPVNKCLTTVGRVWRLRNRGLSIEAVEGQIQILPVPRWKAVRLHWLERPHWLMRWFCLHGCTVATKPSDPSVASTL